eukprot:CAMPEP_0174853304 /NCGR_PEP_ID=MMETSP1114-20130205/27878_1 /TAXON_ID=312471 /ORGANISM="Neobodo designis, Strain CCAP 1951/1" /LENGTH=56 /DNA_ID=CAMNT_0016087939 /DNA_START=233 /DNA_END=400 /DNA_ORIENTATION=+
MAVGPLLRSRIVPVARRVVPVVALCGVQVDLVLVGPPQRHGGDDDHPGGGDGAPIT